MPPALGHNRIAMKIPLFPLDVVLFPGAALPLHIFEERYREMMRECLDREQTFGVVRARREGMAVIGCSAQIVAVLNQYPDGRFDILCQGRDRFEIELLDDSRSFLQAEVKLLVDNSATGHPGRSIDSTRAEREQCAALHFELSQLTNAAGDEDETVIFPHLDLDDAISFQLADAIPSDLEFKQELLSLRSDAQRCKRLTEFYGTVLPKLRRGSLASKHVAGNGLVM